MILEWYNNNKLVLTKRGQKPVNNPPNVPKMTNYEIIPNEKKSIIDKDVPELIGSSILSHKYHLPTLSMASKTTSYFERSIFCRMFFADKRETSCSTDLPP